MYVPLASKRHLWPHYVRGMKENVIMGRLIRAGMEYYRNVEIDRDETIGDSQREEIEDLLRFSAARNRPRPNRTRFQAIATANCYIATCERRS